MKNNGNFLFGLILIVVGGFWVAGTCGLVNLSFLYLLFRFWPALLILAGLNMIFQGNKGVMLLSVLLLVAGSVYCVQNNIAGIQYCDGGHQGYFNQYDKGNQEYYNQCDTPGDILEDFYDMEHIERATLALDLGAGDIVVTSSDNQKLNYSVPKHNRSITFNTKNEEAEIRFFTKSGFNINGFARRQVINYNFELPTNVVWSIDLDAGATDTLLDLQDLFIKKIKVDSGASDCELILGDLNDYTYVDVNSGVSDLRIKVKDGVGLRIKSDQVISDNNYEDIGLKKSKGYFETKGYSSASSQIEIDIEAAVSDVNVEFY